MWVWLSFFAAMAISAEPRPGQSETPPARPGDVAIHEELIAARASRQPAAYELFLARHPAHPLTAVARAELAALKGQRK